MSHGKFDPVDLPSQGRVTVTGPFDPQDPKVHFARVLFLVVQGAGTDTIVIPGEGTWSRGGGNWRGTVQRRGVPDLGGSDRELRANEIARGIAVSIVVKPGRVLVNGEELPPGKEPDSGDKVTFDPPSIEALTWCADFAVKAPPGQATSQTDPSSSYPEPEGSA
jgi:hypothetical protein